MATEPRKSEETAFTYEEHHLTPIAFAVQIGNLDNVYDCVENGADILEVEETATGKEQPSKTKKRKCKSGVFPISSNSALHHKPQEVVKNEDTKDDPKLPKAKVAEEIKKGILWEEVLLKSLKQIDSDKVTAESGTANAQEKSKIPQLITYCSNGNYEKVNNMIKEGANIELLYCNFSPLYFATGNGHLEVVKLLLKYKANVNHRCEKGLTLLMYAAVNKLQNGPAIVQLLLEHKVQVNALSTKNKNTALVFACAHGNLAAVEMLIKWKANVNVMNRYNCTPIAAAALGGHLEIINVLLANGAKMNKPGSIFPMKYAIEDNRPSVVQFLLDKKFDVNSAIDEKYETSLTRACEVGRFEIVKLLVEYNANIELRNMHGYTALMISILNGHKEICEYLLDKGAKHTILLPTAERDSMLLFAVKNNQIEIVKLLLQRGANVEVKNISGCSPLWVAASNGLLCILNLLYQYGADVNAQNINQVSCLEIGFRRGHTDVVRWFVKKKKIFLPKDHDLTQFMALIKKDNVFELCQTCRAIINNAREAQNTKANRNATALLMEVIRESKKEPKKAMVIKNGSRKDKKKYIRKMDKNKAIEVTTDREGNDTQALISQDEDPKAAPVLSNEVQNATGKVETISLKSKVESSNKFDKVKKSIIAVVEDSKFQKNKTDVNGDASETTSVTTSNLVEDCGDFKEVKYRHSSENKEKCKAEQQSVKNSKNKKSKSSIKSTVRATPSQTSKTKLHIPKTSRSTNKKKSSTKPPNKENMTLKEDKLHDTKNTAIISDSATYSNITLDEMSTQQKVIKLSKPGLDESKDFSLKLPDNNKKSTLKQDKLQNIKSTSTKLRPASYSSVLSLGGTPTQQELTNSIQPKYSESRDSVKMLVEVRKPTLKDYLPNNNSITVKSLSGSFSDIVLGKTSPQQIVTNTTRSNCIDSKSWSFKVPDENKKAISKEDKLKDNKSNLIKSHSESPSICNRSAQEKVTRSTQTEYTNRKGPFKIKNPISKENKRASIKSHSAISGTLSAGETSSQQTVTDSTRAKSTESNDPSFTLADENKKPNSKENELHENKSTSIKSYFKSFPSIVSLAKTVTQRKVKNPTSSKFVESKDSWYELLDEKTAILEQDKLLDNSTKIKSYYDSKSRIALLDKIQQIQTNPIRSKYINSKSLFFKPPDDNKTSILNQDTTIKQTLRNMNGISCGTIPKQKISSEDKQNAVGYTPWKSNQSTNNLIPRSKLLVLPEGSSFAKTTVSASTQTKEIQLIASTSNAVTCTENVDNTKTAQSGGTYADKTIETYIDELYLEEDENATQNIFDIFRNVSSPHCQYSLFGSNLPSVHNFGKVFFEKEIETYNFGATPRCSSIKTNNSSSTDYLSFDSDNSWNLPFEEMEAYNSDARRGCNSIKTSNSSFSDFSPFNSDNSWNFPCITCLTRPVFTATKSTSTDDLLVLKLRKTNNQNNEYGSNDSNRTKTFLDYPYRINYEISPRYYPQTLSAPHYATYPPYYDVYPPYHGAYPPYHAAYPQYHGAYPPYYLQYSAYMPIAPPMMCPLYYVAPPYAPRYRYVRPRSK